MFFFLNLKIDVNQVHGFGQPQIQTHFARKKLYYNDMLCFFSNNVMSYWNTQMVNLLRKAADKIKHVDFLKYGT